LSLVSLGFVPGAAGHDAVADTLIGRNRSVLSVQSLNGSSAQDRFYWPMYQASTIRAGRTQAFTSPQPADPAVEENTMMIYPNPAAGDEVRVRIMLNRRVEVKIEIFNLEGERAFSRPYIGNPADVSRTPFDEAIDISRLKSGVYFVRLSVSGGGASAAFVKRLAIKR
jgi:hypothetical protein